MVEPLIAEFKDEVKENEFFRKVVFTGEKSQLVMMSLLPGEEIGYEVHDVDQLLFCVKGEGKVVLEGVEDAFEKGMVACVPAGVHHNILNTDDEKPMKLFTVYSPPQHAAGTIHRTKAEAEAAETAGLEPALS